MKHQNTILLALAALLAVGLSIAVWVYRYDLSRRDVVGNAVDGAVRPLRMEREEMEARLEDIQSRLDAQTLGEGVNILIFTELDPILYEEIFPSLRKLGVPAVLALSDTQFPGEPGLITAEQAAEMVESGWTVCIQWDDWSDPEEYFGGLRVRLDRLGLEWPDTVYITVDRYRGELDPVLEAQGFTILVAHGEENWPALTREDKYPLWHLVSRPWNIQGIREQVGRAADFGGVMAMNVDFSGLSTKYDPELFLPMCRYLADMKNFTMMTPGEARAYRREVPDSEALVAELEWAEGELEEINKEIGMIYQEN